ncbi:ribonuclease P protein component [Aestuariivirga litoralis]|uniref:ribonuclease P protein component n=1 Tax=Aestuariivirga litoralis TaxID=2650924 RepID=UPI0018C5EEF9|nr:ribonuclease P protein component [Aestuariivirga litoralis]MBG1232570.1 ribonuclease P protein component [Aestuariivirga litoralis]
MQRITRRQDFVAAAKAVSWSNPAFLLQARLRSDDGVPRVGFTCTKKLGNAVIRNRIKRRLREAARLGLASVVQKSFDYVVIGRSAAETSDFEILKSDLISAANRLHAKALPKTEAK